MTTPTKQNERTMSQLLVSDSLYTFLYKSLTSGVSFIGFMLIANYVPVLEFGIWMFTLLLVNAVAVIASLGLDNSLVKYIPEFVTTKDHYKLRIAIYSTIGITLLVTIVSSLLIIYLFYDYYSSFFVSGVSLLVVIVLFITLATMRTIQASVDNVFVGFQDYKTLFFTSLVGSVIFLLSLTYFLINDATITGIMIAYILSDTSNFVIKYLLIRSKLSTYPILRIAEKKEVIKILFKFGGILYISAIVGFLAQRIDQFMVGLYFSIDVFGEYSPATILSRVLIYFTVGFQMVLNAKMSELNSLKKGDIMKNITSYATEYFLYFSGGISILLALFSEEIIQLLFGTSYSLSSRVLPLLLIAYTIVALYRPIASQSFGRGTVHFNTAVSLTTIFTFLGFNFLLLPLFGIYGLVYSTILSNLIAFFVWVIIGKLFFTMIIIKRKVIIYSFVYILTLFLITYAKIDSNLYTVAILFSVFSLIITFKGIITLLK